MIKITKELILKIFLLLSISIPLIVFLSFLEEDGKIKNKNFSKNVIINTIDENYVEIEENITVDVLLRGFDDINVPLAIFKENPNEKVIEDLEVYLNDNKLYQNANITKENMWNLDFTKYNMKELKNSSCVYIDKININPKYKNLKKYYIKIKYKTKVENIFKEYNNFTVINFLKNDKFKRLNIDINFNKNISNINVNYFFSNINKINDNSYLIDLSKIKYFEDDPSVAVIFDTNVFANSKKMNEKYNELNYKEKYIENLKIRYGTTIKYLMCITFSEIILIIILFILSRKPRIKKEYVNDPKVVIKPALAEAIIDRKIRRKGINNVLYY